MNDDPCRMWMYGVRVSLNEQAPHQCPPVPRSQSRITRCRCGTFRVLTLSSQKPLIGLRCVVAHIDARCLTTSAEAR